MSAFQTTPIRISVCFNTKRHQLEVYGDTTVDELTILIWLEVLGEVPPDTENEGVAVSKQVRLIYKGRQLSSPEATMSSLGVKNNDRIMVLKRKTHEANNMEAQNNRPEENSSSSVLEPLMREVTDIEAKAATLSQEVDSLISIRTDSEQNIRRSLKTLAGANEELMKLLCKLDAVETNGNEELRRERKSLVIKLQKSQTTLDRLSASLKDCLKE